MHNLFDETWSAGGPKDKNANRLGWRGAACEPSMVPSFKSLELKRAEYSLNDKDNVLVSC